MECPQLLTEGAPLPFPPVPSLQNTFGAFLICTCLGCTLFGLTSHQTYRYFRLYPTDKRGMKLLIGLILCLDMLHTITNVHACYHYLITNYFNPCALNEGVWSIRLGIVEGGVMILVAHCFYARRLYLLGGRSLIPVVVIGFLLLAEIGFSITATAETFIQVVFSKFIPYMWQIWGVLLAAVCVDVVATSVLTHYLRKSRTGFKKTDSMVDILMVYAVNTGLSTSVLTIAAFISSILSRDTLIWAAITIVATKMYANSLLAVVNSRRSILDRGLEGFETGSFGLKIVSAQRHSLGQISPIQFQPPPSAVIDIKVTTETFLDVPRGGTSGDDQGVDSAFCST
ncbi:hypothetical protein K466DRAFT_588629 [Polyporus arcularius HHB13444]|uniref:DUF6534 domain-containing protein n=1 Tax=Polyporus arcularius HHB13444 TaxID=1314778 RepID=A0A5C3PFW1_9APHY|nr:hypothetical protein K466DRAFT_588629 [Polyporus arcularius HHB13444]